MSFVVLIRGISKSNHLGVQSTFNLTQTYVLETGVFALGKDVVVLRDQLTLEKSAPTYKQAMGGVAQLGRVDAIARSDFVCLCGGVFVLVCL